MWIEVHDTLPDHPKVVKVAEALNIPDSQVLGMLLCIWFWGAQQRPGGILTEVDWKAIERVARWSGEPRALFAALISAKLIDENGNGYVIHDWMEYAGKLEAIREKDRQRKRAPVGKGAEIQRSSNGTPPEFQRNSSRYRNPNPNHKDDYYWCGRAHV